MGLARLTLSDEGETVSALTSTGTVMGTQDYMAPEQAQDAHEVDIRADLYSLGCTLYFLLSGRPPFPKGSYIQKAIQHQFKEPPPLEQLRPDVPAPVAAVVRKLMAKRPEDRFQTPLELAEALETAAPPAGPADPFQGLSGRASGPVRRPRKRWPLVLAGGVSALLLGAGLAVAFLFPGWLQPPPGATAATTHQSREATAEAAYRSLLERCQDRQGDRDRLRDDLLSFRRRYFDLPPALRVPDLLRDLPSPLDRLDGKDVPELQRFDGRPQELVAVLGDHRGLSAGAVNGVAVHPDGRRVASCAQDSRVRIWDARTMRLLQSVEVPAHVRAVAFTPDGKHLAGAGADGRVRVWEVTAEGLKPGPVSLAPPTGEAPAELWSVAFAGERVLAGARQGKVYRWEWPASPPRPRPPP